MIRLKFAIVLGFAVMFVAGLSVGRTRVATPVLVPSTQPPPPVGDEFPNFDKQLALTDPQKQQMHKIWHDARGHADGLARQFRDVDHQRDESIKALLTPEQKSQYDEIQRQRDARFASVHAEIAKIMDGAEKQTESILTPEQLPKFKDIVKQHAHHRGPPPWGGPPGGHRRPRSDTQSVDAPSTLPNP